MGVFRSLLIKLGLADVSAERTPISVFLLDDDYRRHAWFEKRFNGDDLVIAETVEEAKELLTDGKFDAISWTMTCCLIITNRTTMMIFQTPAMRSLSG